MRPYVLVFPLTATRIVSNISTIECWYHSMDWHSNNCPHYNYHRPNLHSRHMLYRLIWAAHREPFRVNTAWLGFSKSGFSLGCALANTRTPTATEKTSLGKVCKDIVVVLKQGQNFDNLGSFETYDTRYRCLIRLLNPLKTHILAYLESPWGYITVGKHGFSKFSPQTGWNECNDTIFAQNLKFSGGGGLGLSL